MNTFCQTYSTDPIFKELFRRLPQMGVSMRKQLILLCRHLGLNEGDGNFAENTHAVLSEILSWPKIRTYRTDEGHTVHCSQDEIRSRLNATLSNPAKAGLIISMAFLSPFDKEDVDAEILKSFMKEVNVMNRNGYDPDLNFRPFSGHSDFEVPWKIKEGLELSEYGHEPEFGGMDMDL